MSVMTYRDAVSSVLREALDQDERVFLMGEDIGPYGGAFAVTKGFWEQYGKKRIKDSPLAESVIVGAGVGAAMAGLRPVVELMTINFSLLAMDQIVNHAAKIRYMSGGQFSIPLIIRTVTGAGASVGATHSQSFEGWYASVPGLTVVYWDERYSTLEASDRLRQSGGRRRRRGRPARIAARERLDAAAAAVILQDYLDALTAAGPACHQHEAAPRPY